MTAYRFIRSEEANHSIRLMCRVLKVVRSCFYTWRAGRTHSGREDVTARVHIRAIHRRHKGRYGAPRITAELRAQGLLVNHKRVARLMREEGLAGTPRRRFRGTTTDSAHQQPVAPNLLKREFTVEAPNIALVGDITYLPTELGWVYLAVLIDLYSRKVVGWALDTAIDTPLCLEALRRVVATRGPLRGAIHHTDRGCQYTSKAYTAAVEQAGMQQSMSRKGNCWDNAVAESFFGTLEQELVAEARWHDHHDARKAVSHYIHQYFNAERRHSTLGYLSPCDFESFRLSSCSEAA